ncbi:cyclic nucleotide-binding domain-containing protein [Burkholderia alba]|uniref:hypothetical protein n=1 Tax=Burkholderia alba TaxID=2683677 RepID=UPI002B05E9D0|nr:hypothetical protein [Burkholderia alba]
MIEQLERYIDDPARLLPTLNAANGSDRQQRLERRIACVQLLRAMVKYLDLPSLRVGVPQSGGGFLSLTLKFLARHAGLSMRRAERAMRDLMRAGLVNAQQRCEKAEEGGYRGLAALRQLPAALFGAFGLAKWLRHERSKAVMRRYRAAAERAKDDRQRDRDSRAAAQATLALKSVTQRLTAHKRRPAPPSTASETIAEQIHRRIGLIKQQHPDWDHARCYDAAYRERVPPEAPATDPPADTQLA